MSQLNPNVIIKNIYYMYAYAFDTLVLDSFKNVESEKFEKVHDLYAALIDAGMSYLIKKGIYKEYVETNQNLSTVRGKININNTIKSSIKRSKQINCDLDDYTQNNLFNQIIKTSIIFLIQQSDVDDTRKINLKKKLVCLSNIDTIMPSSIQWSKITFNRNNRTYKAILGVCQLMWDEMLLTEFDGKLTIQSFLDSQVANRLYEKFILNYYKKEWPEYNTGNPKIPWLIDENDNTDMLPGMQTDVAVTKGKKCLILDAKLYTSNTALNGLSNKTTIKSSHLYQMFAYAKNKKYESNQWADVAAILVYAKTDEEIQPDGIYHMGDVIVGAKNLDLNQDFNNIRICLDNILKTFMEGSI